MPETTRQYQKYKNIQQRHITVWLKAEENPTSFFCPYCRNKICDHHRAIIQIVPGYPPANGEYALNGTITIKETIKCSNKNCNTYFHFETLV